MGRRGVLAIPAGTVLNEEKQTEERDPQSEFIALTKEGWMRSVASR